MTWFTMALFFFFKFSPFPPLSCRLFAFFHDLSFLFTWLFFFPPYVTNDFWAVSFWEKEGGADPPCLPGSAAFPQSTSCRLSHEQFGNTWSSQSCKEEAWHLPNSEKIRSESAVWKASTLSSEISSTAGHKTRDNEGKQTAWGGVSVFPPTLTFGNSVSKGCEPLAGFTAPLP